MQDETHYARALATHSGFPSQPRFLDSGCRIYTKVVLFHYRATTYLPMGKYGTVSPVCGSTNVRGSPAFSTSFGRPSLLPPPSVVALSGDVLPTDLLPSPFPLFDFLPLGGGERENQCETSVPAAAISGSAKGPLFASIKSVKSTTYFFGLRHVSSRTEGGGVDNAATRQARRYLSSRNMPHDVKVGA